MKTKINKRILILGILLSGLLGGGLVYAVAGWRIDQMGDKLRFLFDDAVKVTVEPDGRVGIGEAASASAILQIKGTDKGLLVSRVTPLPLPSVATNGLLVYDDTPSEKCFKFFQNGAWSQCLGVAQKISTQAPTTPREGDIYYDTVGGVVKVYDGLNYDLIRNTQVPTGDVFPTVNVQEGNLFYKTTEKSLFIYQGGGWKNVLSSVTDLKAFQSSCTVHTVPATSRNLDCPAGKLLRSIAFEPLSGSGVVDNLSIPEVKQIECCGVALGDYYWDTGEWGTCSFPTTGAAECGNGTQTRSVVCKDKAGVGQTGTDAQLEALCGVKPSPSRSCSGDSCRWEAGDWQACDTTCGHGNQVRTPICKGALGNTYDSIKCQTALGAHGLVLSQACQSCSDCSVATILQNNVKDNGQSLPLYGIRPLFNLNGGTTVYNDAELVPTSGHPWSIFKAEMVAGAAGNAKIMGQDSVALGYDLNLSTPLFALLANKGSGFSKADIAARAEDGLDPNLNNQNPSISSEEFPYRYLLNENLESSSTAQEICQIAGFRKSLFGSVRKAFASPNSGNKLVYYTGGLFREAAAGDYVAGFQWNRHIGRVVCADPDLPDICESVNTCTITPPAGSNLKKVLDAGIGHIQNGKLLFGDFITPTYFIPQETYIGRAASIVAGVSQIPVTGQYLEMAPQLNLDESASGASGGVEAANLNPQALCNALGFEFAVKATLLDGGVGGAWYFDSAKNAFVRRPIGTVNETNVKELQCGKPKPEICN